jgi:hypothetical protein
MKNVNIIPPGEKGWVIHRDGTWKVSFREKIHSATLVEAPQGLSGLNYTFTNGTTVPSENVFEVAEQAYDECDKRNAQPQNLPQQLLEPVANNDDEDEDDDDDYDDYDDDDDDDD